MSDRKFGLDVLKIISMYGIILFHFANHSQIDLYNVPLSWSWTFLAFFKLWGGIGDCCFVLITGYLYHNRSIKLKRITNLWCSVWFYSVLLGMCCIAIGWGTVSYKGIVKMIFPVIYNEYPFFSAYIILFILIPFINKLLSEINLREYKLLAVILFLVVSIIPTIFNSSWIMTDTQLPAFLMLYVIGAGVGQYGRDFVDFGKRERAICLFIIIIAATWLSEILLHIYISKYSFYFAWDMNKTPVVIGGLLLFYVFLNVTINGNKIREFLPIISSSVFGVYLIHMNRYLKTPLLDVLFDNSSIYGTWWLPIQVLLGGAFVFVVCSLIEILRNKIMGNVIDNAFYRIYYFLVKR